jgi:hypothetical protein
MKVQENDIVQNTSHDGYKVKGKVIAVFTSIDGRECVNINNFYEARTTEQIKLIKKAN